MKKAMAKKEDGKEVARIELPEVSQVIINIIGETPYVGTNFADETRQELLEEQSGKARTKVRAKRDIEKEVNGRRHIIDGIDCIPCIAFRTAMINTAKDDALSNVNGEMIRRNIINVSGDHSEYTSIRNGNGKELHPGPDIGQGIVKLANGKPHVCYRPTYNNWSTEITITYLSDRLSQDDVLTLLACAGITTGVGDTRRIGGGRFRLKGNE